MIISNSSTQVSTQIDPHIRQLIQQRYTQLGPEGTCMVVVEPGDNVAALEQLINCPILHNLIDDVPFGEEGFAPSFEILEDHGYCYEMVFIFSEDGIEIFIPKIAGIDADLLALCALYAIPEERTEDKL